MFVFRIVLHKDKTHSSAHVLQSLHLGTTAKGGLPELTHMHLVHIITLLFLTKTEVSYPK